MCLFGVFTPPPLPRPFACIILRFSKEESKTDLISFSLSFSHNPIEKTNIFGIVLKENDIIYAKVICLVYFIAK